MKQAELLIVNKLGLHARSSAKLVSLAKSFASDIKLTRDGNEVDGKRIMNVLMLAAPAGTSLTLTVSGADEDAAFDALKNLIEDGFGEEI
ncbi:MAG: HPr family phosphocarrier protein [Proteobacteria bacterium]|nr:HPr family phosphocarrier protein [Pseudomonadota bacterium]